MAGCKRCFWRACEVRLRPKRRPFTPACAARWAQPWARRAIRSRRSRRSCRVPRAGCAAQCRCAAANPIEVALFAQPHRQGNLHASGALEDGGVDNDVQALWIELHEVRPEADIRFDELPQQRRSACEALRHSSSVNGNGALPSTARWPRATSCCTVLMPMPANVTRIATKASEGLTL